MSILAALGRFLGLLVSVTLMKLWKAADLGGEGMRGQALPWLCPSLLPSPTPLFPLLPFALLFQPRRLVAALGHEEEDSGTQGRKLGLSNPISWLYGERGAIALEGCIPPGKPCRGRLRRGVHELGVSSAGG